MNRELTCILCPRGCQLTVTGEKADLKVTGNSCKNGIHYGISECLNPVRTVTSVLRISNRCDTMVSVKTSVPVRKQDMLYVMSILKNTEITAPVKSGDVLISNVCGADILATKTID